MKNVLLTGAAGFIGSHLAETLAAQGVHLRAFIHYNSRGDPGLLRYLNPRLLKEIELVSGDLADADAVQKAVRGCDTVFHLGALVSVPYSYHHPQQVVRTNINGTLNVLLASRDAGVERLVHASTAEVYGTARALPVTEDHPLQAQSPYSASRIAADKLAESFYCAYGLPVVTVRPFSTYGPRQAARALIPALISQALTSPEISLGYLDGRRDYLYVTDTVDGFLKAACTAGVEGHVFNLGAGREVTLGQLLETILGLAPAFAPQRERPTLKTTANHVRGTGRLDKPAAISLIADSAHARTELGWQPSVTLEDGLRETMAWVAAQLDPCRPALVEF